MGGLSRSGDIGLAFLGGFLAAIIVGAVAAALFIRTTDYYGLSHWKLNAKMPLASTWMNLGYWTDADGRPVTVFETACANLLKEILITARLVPPHSPAGEDLTHSKVTPTEPEKQEPLAILDVGFGCGDQTIELLRLTQARTQDWERFRYIGLTLNAAQIDAARRRITRDAVEARAATNGTQAPPQDCFSLHCADAAKPRIWSAEVRAALEQGLARNYFERRKWLLALDCAYHFNPSRWLLLSYAAKTLRANFMAFDLVLNENAKWTDKILVKMLGVIMGCPVNTFVSETEYRHQLETCGYEQESIIFRDISEHVFLQLADSIDHQERALSLYGVSIGGYKLAGRLFAWFGHSKVVRAVIVVARSSSAAEEA